ncbi:MAG: hypothetical protein IJT62_05435 [Oscillospiraceae bacterium]|nr:hypothetical protein [Oscillospiraceae bacterium]
MKEQTTHRYDDIIDLPHHVSETRPRMSRLDRAAQFAPFAALTGFEAVVTETARRAEEAALWEDTEPAEEY